jgi:hypothetical protein
LSDLELSIKKKVESIGIPIKDWDVEIYRGVLTGYNEAFIISSEKRNEILNNCVDDKERERTAAIIRPILRGRDVARYRYNWADLWLINTHNGIKGKLERIHIEDYPAIKQHLDYYWDKIESRVDKGDTPYNLRNCAYMDEFSKTKIIYPNMTKFLPFVLDTEGFLTNQKCFIMTGEKLGFLTAFLNSSLFKFCFANKFPELQGKTRELSKIFMDEIPVIRVTLDQEQKFADLVKDIQNDYSKEKAINIDKQIFELYGLDIEEQSYIGFIDFREN